MRCWNAKFFKYEKFLIFTNLSSLDPISSYNNFYNSQFIGDYRMVAQLSKFGFLSSKLHTDRHFIGVNSHPDLNVFKFKHLTLDDVRSLVLFPGFAKKLELFVKSCVIKSDASFNVKSNLLALLTSTKLFFARSKDEYADSLQFCFDLAIYTRYTSICRGYTDFAETDIMQYPIFQNSQNPLLNALLFILKGC
jgi:hypothetical protein